MERNRPVDDRIPALIAGEFAVPATALDC